MNRSATIRADGQGRTGFSIVELVIAIVILAVGLLGLAGSTAYVIRTVTMADLNTQRAAALQTTIERLRAMPFDSIRTDADSVGAFSVTWTSTPSGAIGSAHRKQLVLVTEGPGMRAGEGSPMPVLSHQAVDTFTYVILRR
jgi:type IV pilus assembly protein PilV